MPQLSGVKLAVRFRRSWPSCNILLFSGNAGTIDRSGEVVQQRKGLVSWE